MYDGAKMKPRSIDSQAYVLVMPHVLELETSGSDEIGMQGQEHRPTGGIQALGSSLRFTCSHLGKLCKASNALHLETEGSTSGHY